jgi:hypothetical protein
MKQQQQPSRPRPDDTKGGQQPHRADPKPPPPETDPDDDKAPGREHDVERAESDRR